MSRVGFKSGIWLLNVPAPVHCFSITSMSTEWTMYFDDNRGYRNQNKLIAFSFCIECKTKVNLPSPVLVYY